MRLNAIRYAVDGTRGTTDFARDVQCRLDAIQEAVHQSHRVDPVGAARRAAKQRIEIPRSSPTKEKASRRRSARRAPRAALRRPFRRDDEGKI